MFVGNFSIEIQKPMPLSPSLCGKGLAGILRGLRFESLGQHITH